MPFIMPSEYERRIRITHTTPKTSMGEGMLVLTRYRGINLQGILELLWTPWMMITAIHKAVGGDKMKKIICINFYRPPQQHHFPMVHLRFIISSIKEKHKSSCIIVCGDFNMRPEQVEEFATKTPLTVI